MARRTPGRHSLPLLLGNRWAIDEELQGGFSTGPPSSKLLAPILRACFIGALPCHVRRIIRTAAKQRFFVIDNPAGTGAAILAVCRAGVIPFERGAGGATPFDSSTAIPFTGVAIVCRVRSSRVGACFTLGPGMASRYRFGTADGKSGKMQAIRRNMPGRFCTAIAKLWWVAFLVTLLDAPSCGTRSHSLLLADDPIPTCGGPGDPVRLDGILYVGPMHFRSLLRG